MSVLAEKLVLRFQVNFAGWLFQPADERQTEVASAPDPASCHAWRMPMIPSAKNVSSPLSRS